MKGGSSHLWDAIQQYPNVLLNALVANELKSLMKPSNIGLESWRFSSWTKCQNGRRWCRIPVVPSTRMSPAFLWTLIAGKYLLYVVPSKCTGFLHQTRLRLPWWPVSTPWGISWIPCSYSPDKDWEILARNYSLMHYTLKRKMAGWPGRVFMIFLKCFIPFAPKSQFPSLCSVCGRLQNTHFFEIIKFLSITWHCSVLFVGKCNACSATSRYSIIFCS